MINTILMKVEYELVTFSPIASCMIDMWVLIPLIILPLVKSVSNAPISWLRIDFRNSNLKRDTCLSLAYIQHPISAFKVSDIFRTENLLHNLYSYDAIFIMSNFF